MVSSNIETTSHGWLMDNWPSHLQFHRAVGIELDGEPCEPYEVVPRTQQALWDWAYVRRNPSAADHTREMRLLYREPPVFHSAPAGVIYPVGVRVQGFVKSCNLRPLGNWSSDKNPASALQHIVLHGGDDCEAEFGQYQSGIAEIVTYIHRCLNSRGADIDRDRDSMFIARRVFTRESVLCLPLTCNPDQIYLQVNSANRAMPSALVLGDDPAMLTAAIDRDWRVTKKLSIGVYATEDNTFSALDAQNIGPGDFVDVCVGFDIEARYSYGRRPSYKVHLSIEHVLMLLPSQSTRMDMQLQTIEGDIGLGF